MDDSAGPDRTLSLSELERHDQICDRFESSWKQGHTPKIEDFLREVPESEAANLFVALLRVELEHQPIPPPAETYRNRFPDLARFVDSVFNDHAGTGPFLDALLDTLYETPAIPGYEILGPLGQGGMGVVYRARHRELNRVVAIKMVRSGLVLRPNQLIRFQLEAQAVAALSHPHVVPLYEFGQVNGQPYLVMELVEGGSLSDRLNGKPADPLWAAGLVEQLASAMSYIHERKMIHRDLKPANVLLSNDGTPKITDFGLAKRLTADDPGLTQTYAILGTACYMSPEQARGETKSVGPASDVYALGGILYECLTGRPPFREATYALTIAKVTDTDPIQPTDLVQELPTDLEAICLKCLNKDPEHRYTAQELAEDLARFRQNLPVLARPLSVRDRHARWAQRIGYQLGELLEETATALCYSATQLAINRTVRLKLSAGIVGTANHAILKREADAIGGLDHPNVIRLYDYGEQHNQPYLVLEQIENNQTLAQRIGRARNPGDPGSAEYPTPLAVRQIAELALMITVGLQAIHDHGVIHGGLRTDAIFLTKDLVPKIGQYTFATRIDRTDSKTETIPERPGSYFVAPEFLSADPTRIGPHSDLYSLGAILVDLLATVVADSSKPFDENSRPVVPPNMDLDLTAIIKKCLMDDPQLRYPSAGALALDLQLYLTSPTLSNSSFSDASGATVLTERFIVSDRSARYRLRMIEGSEGFGDTFDLPRDRVMIGRLKNNTIRLKNQKVSRVHCAIIWNEETACHELVDLAAHNGTYLNNVRIRGVRRLSDGDQIGLANFRFVFELLAKE